VVEGYSFENKVSILAELWMNYRDDEELQDFIEFNDLGLPLAYFLLHEIVLPTESTLRKSKLRQTLPSLCSLIFIKPFIHQLNNFV
jgi:hypothetical protein